MLDSSLTESVYEAENWSQWMYVFQQGVHGGASLLKDVNLQERSHDFYSRAWNTPMVIREARTLAVDSEQNCFSIIVDLLRKMIEAKVFAAYDSDLILDFLEGHSQPIN